MIRNFLSVIAGILTGWACFTLFQVVSHLVTPSPEGFDPNELTALKRIVDSMPVYAWVVLILGYAVGSFAGGFVIGKFAESKTRFFAVLLAVFFMLGWLANIVTIPHPILVVVIVFAVFVPVSLLGHRIAVNHVKSADSQTGDSH